MKENSKKIKLNEQQSTILLKLGLDSGENKVKQETKISKSDVLLDMLASKLPADKVIMDSLPGVLQSLSGELESISGISIGDLLSDTKTQLALIRKMKDYARELGSCAKDNIERDAALVIYFSAIAHALVYHDIKITEYTYEKLQQSFEKLFGYDWISKSLQELFKKAQLYCNENKS